MKEGITKITPNINYSTNFGFQNLSSGDNIANYSENIYPIQNIFQGYNYGNEEKKIFFKSNFHNNSKYATRNSGLQIHKYNR